MNFRSFLMCASRDRVCWVTMKAPSHCNLWIRPSPKECLSAQGCPKLWFYLFVTTWKHHQYFPQECKPNWPMLTHHVQNHQRGLSLTQAMHPRCCWLWRESCKNSSDRGPVVCQGLVPRQSSVLTQLACLDFLQLYYRIWFCHWPVILIVAGKKNDNPLKMSFTLKLLCNYFFIPSIS